MTVKTIKIDNVEYVRADAVNVPAETCDGLQYAIVRTHSAGVFAGYIKERQGQEMTMINARRLWYWSGAASLSQLSQDGVKNPELCKFPCEVPVVILTQVIEILPATQRAKESIDGVAIWEK